MGKCTFWRLILINYPLFGWFRLYPPIHAKTRIWKIQIQEASREKYLFFGYENIVLLSKIVEKQFSLQHYKLIVDEKIWQSLRLSQKFLYLFSNIPELKKKITLERLLYSCNQFFRGIWSKFSSGMFCFTICTLIQATEF